ncbi:MAG: alpha-2-macroglobulin family protein [Acidobacteriota bacterium]
MLADPRQLLSQSTSEITAQKIADLAATNNRQYLQTEAASTEYVTVSGEAPNAEMRLRKDFNALAFFAASVPTDARGRATVSLKLPDNLTRYRVMAVAAMGENQFGTTESTITARLPLMVRPSAPRFLNFGDRFALPVVVQNQTDKPLTVNVAVRASNALFVGATTNDASHTSAGRRVTVPANDRVRNSFCRDHGTARSGALSDCSNG